MGGLPESPDGEVALLGSGAGAERSKAPGGGGAGFLVILFPSRGLAGCGTLQKKFKHSTQWRGYSRDKRMIKRRDCGDRTVRGWHQNCHNTVTPRDHQ